MSETPTFPQGSGPQHPQPPSPSARPAPPPVVSAVSPRGGAGGSTLTAPRLGLFFPSHL